MKALIFFALTALAAESTFLEDLFTDSLKKVEYTSPTTLITFIRPGCGYCEMQLKALKCVQAKLGAKVNILAVQSSGTVEDQRSDVRPLKVAFPVLKGTPEFLSRYEAQDSPTPLTAVITKGGKLRSKLLGARPCEFLVEHIKAL